MIQILSNYFVAGAVIESGKIVEAAPIIKYMIGWDKERTLAYIKKKGWNFQYVKNEV